jgi:hypothetical protein
MTVALTDHAVQRYQERVRPDLDLDAARAELEALTVGAELTTDRPWPSCRHSRNVAGFVNVGFGAALTLIREGKRFVAVTCLTNPAFHVKRSGTKLPA